MNKPTNNQPYTYEKFVPDASKQTPDANIVSSNKNNSLKNNQQVKIPPSNNTQMPPKVAVRQSPVANNVPAKQPILSIVNLTKKYGERIAVDNISFNVYPGQIMGFLGANGAGKSTTIKMLTGLAHITSGDVHICGHSVKSGFEQAIKNVGAMIEIPVFYPYLSGYNNLKFFAKLSGKVSNQRIDEVATLVGLGNRIKDKVAKYSLGMKQRLGVAQALLNKPKLLILDEPTNGLDANGIREFRFMLKQLAYKEGISILISSHILGEMENLCDIVTIIDKGKIIAVKTMESIKHSCLAAGSQFVKCNAPNLTGKLLMEKFGYKCKIQGNKVYFNSPNNTMLSQIIVLLTQHKILVYGAGDVDYSLEDVFLNIVNQKNGSTSIS